MGKRINRLVIGIKTKKTRLTVDGLVGASRVLRRREEHVEVAEDEQQCNHNEVLHRTSTAASQAVCSVPVFIKNIARAAGETITLLSGSVVALVRSLVEPLLTDTGCFHHVKDA